MRAWILAVIASACLVGGAVVLTAGGVPGTAIGTGLAVISGVTLIGSLLFDLLLQRRPTAN